MNYQLIKKSIQTYLECLPDESKLANDNDALDLVVACGINDTVKLMLHAENLTEDFFKLWTG